MKHPLTILTMAFVLSFPVLAIGGATIRELPDRVVVEITGTPSVASPADREKEDLSERIAALETTLGKLRAEDTDLRMSRADEQPDEARERRTKAGEKYNQIRTYEKELEELKAKQQALAPQLTHR